MTTQTVYWNVTGRGNVQSYTVLVEDTHQSGSHKAHTQLIRTMRTGATTVEDGQYFYRRKDAEARAAVWTHLLDQNPRYKRASYPSLWRTSHRTSRCNRPTR